MAQTGMQSHRNNLNGKQCNENIIFTRGAAVGMPYYFPHKGPLPFHLLLLHIHYTVGRCCKQSSTEPLVFPCPSPPALDPWGPYPSSLALYWGSPHCRAQQAESHTCTERKPEIQGLMKSLRDRAISNILYITSS